MHTFIFILDLIVYKTQQIIKWLNLLFKQRTVRTQRTTAIIYRLMQPINIELETTG